MPRRKEPQPATGITKESEAHFLKGLIATNRLSLFALLSTVFSLSETQIVEIMGVPGSGKTTAVLHALRLAEERGLATRFVEFDQLYAYCRSQQLYGPDSSRWGNLERTHLSSILMKMVRDPELLRKQSPSEVMAMLVADFEQYRHTVSINEASQRELAESALLELQSGTVTFMELPVFGRDNGTTAVRILELAGENLRGDKRSTMAFALMADESIRRRAMKVRAAVAELDESQIDNLMVVLFEMGLTLRPLDLPSGVNRIMYDHIRKMAPPDIMTILNENLANEAQTWFSDLPPSLEHEARVSEYMMSIPVKMRTTPFENRELAIVAYYMYHVAYTKLGYTPNNFFVVWNQFNPEYDWAVDLAVKSAPGAN